MKNENNKCKIRKAKHPKMRGKIFCCYLAYCDIYGNKTEDFDLRKMLFWDKKHKRYEFITIDPLI